MRSIGIAEIVVIIAWLMILAIPILAFHYLRECRRLLSRLSDDTAAIRRALEPDARM